MRPAGEIRQVLLRAVSELATPDRAPTLTELAHHAQVGIKAAETTVKNMRRHGHLRIVRTRKVAYRNRPVAEYAPAEPVADEGSGFVDLAHVMSGWGG
ncbi:MAG: hypothetical protein AB1455_09965 [Pseudomonadota bacterium]